MIQTYERENQPRQVPHWNNFTACAVLFFSMDIGGVRAPCDHLIVASAFSVIVLTLSAW